MSGKRTPVVRRLAEKALLNLPVTVILTAATPGLGLAAAVVQGRALAAVVSLLIVSASLTGVSAWLRSTHSGYREVAALLARTLSGGGLPVIVTLGRLTSKYSANEAKPPGEALKHQVLRAARRTASHTREPSLTRAAYYEFGQDGYLHLVDALWDPGAPRRMIGADGDHDQDLLQFASNPLRGKRVDDIEAEDSFLDIFEIGKRRYRSCIACAVGVKEADFKDGLLVVVSSEPKAFAESDLEALRLLAGALAAGLAHVKGL
ncbi:MAG TPA: hypothetical protein VKZ82_22245 [Nonomuraea sp.]|nr:hypothetical protein [Nonomuraea sp.]